MEGSKETGYSWQYSGFGGLGKEGERTAACVPMRTPGSALQRQAGGSGRGSPGSPTGAGARVRGTAEARPRPEGLGRRPPLSAQQVNGWCYEHTCSLTYKFFPHFDIAQSVLYVFIYGLKSHFYLRVIL